MVDNPAPPSSARIDVWMAPADHGNPYQRLLLGALTQRGATVRVVNRLRFRDAISAERRGAVLNLHWIEFMIHSADSGVRAATVSVAKALHLLAVLAIARMRRIRIVWTVHNLEPHEARGRWIYRPLGWLVARLADSVLVHSGHCATQITGRLGKSNVAVAYHGNYIGAYPPPRRDRRQVRLSLGVPPDAHLLLAFGLVRPYKQLVELIAEVRRIEDPRVFLLIAGRPLTEEMRRQVESAAAADARIVLRLERIPDAEVAELHLAADLAVFAYSDVFSSGALMLALSHGLPVIAPDDSTATELAPAPAVRAFPPGGLFEALTESAAADRGARRCALLSAERHGWDAMAAKVLGDPAPIGDSR
jgi:glycosyltransferase involved in cell wall biosynthesis